MIYLNFHHISPHQKKTISNIFIIFSPPKKQVPTTGWGEDSNHPEKPGKNPSVLEGDTATIIAGPVWC